MRKVSWAIGLFIERRVYRAPCNAKGEIEDDDPAAIVVDIIASIPILSSFSTNRIPDNAFFSDLVNEVVFDDDEEEEDVAVVLVLLLISDCEVSPLNVRFNNSAPLVKRLNDSDVFSCCAVGEDDKDEDDEASSSG